MVRGSGVRAVPGEYPSPIPPVIYTIPPRCPIYYVKYVRVYGYTPTVAYVGYTAGYTGCYVYNHTVVYGTGYAYRPWHAPLLLRASVDMGIRGSL